MVGLEVGKRGTDQSQYQKVSICFTDKGECVWTASCVWGHTKSLLVGDDANFGLSCNLDKIPRTSGRKGQVHSTWFLSLS